MNDEANYVGCRNPPRDTKFKKGKSGNPRGRPKGSVNLATIVQRALRQKIAVHENGKRKIISKAEAIGKQLVNKAASGDLRALNHLARLQRAAEDPLAQQKHLTRESLRSLTDQELEAIARGEMPVQ